MSPPTTTAPTTTLPVQLRLPGPAPLGLDGDPRSVLVVAAHPGDVLVGFGVGVHAMQAAGWPVRIVTLYRDPDAGAAVLPAVERARATLDRGSLGATHHLAESRAERAAALAAAIALAEDHDVVVLPWSDDPTSDHAIVADALIAGLSAGGAAGPAVLRFLLPGHATGLEHDPRLRRMTAPRRDLQGLLDQRAWLHAQLPCMGDHPADDGGLLTASDLVLI
jgi:LmbE family N-acetylglucosaminyl deacetylase